MEPEKGDDEDKIV